MRLSLLVCLAACGPTVVHHTPVEVSARYPLNGWPLNRVDVQVKDGRPGRQSAAPLLASIKANIEKSLSPPTLNPGDKLTLQVTLDEIVANLDDGRWRAKTRLSATLTDIWGKNVANYAGRGEVSKTNTLGLRTAQLASEEATSEALRQLLKMLDGGSAPVR